MRNPVSRQRSTWLAIGLGQVLSGTLCLAALTSEVITEMYSVQVPNIQNFTMYLLVGLTFAPTLAFRQGRRNLLHIIKHHSWKYFLLSLGDVEGNYFVVKSFQYTNLSSIRFIETFSIPTVLLLSRHFLKVRFRSNHVMGVVLCILAVVCLILEDLQQGATLYGIAGRDQVTGDLLCFAGAVIFGVCDVAQEILLKSSCDWIEYLAMMGIFGTFITAIQVIFLEHEEVMDITSTIAPHSLVLIMLASALCMMLYYVLSTLLIRQSGAVIYNLSILTADFYSVTVGAFLLKYSSFNYGFYLVSFVFVIGGVIVYQSRPPDTVSSAILPVTSNDKDNNIIRFKRLTAL